MLNTFVRLSGPAPRILGARHFAPAARQQVQGFVRAPDADTPRSQRAIRRVILNAVVDGLRWPVTNVPHLPSRPDA